MDKCEKKPRIETNFSQLHSSEVFEIDKHTISIWGIEKSYPDMISDLNMSDLDNVSQDDLLTEKQVIINDGKYLDENKNKGMKGTKLLKMMKLSYLAAWIGSIIIFWVSKDIDAMGYSLVFLWGILPVMTFVTSMMIGLNHCWGNYKWIGAIGFGFMYMIAEYATFSMANNLLFNKINLPEFGMLVAGSSISLIAMSIGHGLKKHNNSI